MSALPMRADMRSAAIDVRCAISGAWWIDDTRRGKPAQARDRLRCSDKLALMQLKEVPDHDVACS